MNQVHALLCKKRVTSLLANYVSSHTPSEDFIVRDVSESIVITLKEGFGVIEERSSDLIRVRAERLQTVSGVVGVTGSGNSYVITFTASKNYAFDAYYTCYINGDFITGSDSLPCNRDFALTFKTAKVPAVRLCVSCVNRISGLKVASALPTLHRTTADLFEELKQLVSFTFRIPCHTIASMYANELNLNLVDNRSVGLLVDSSSVIVLLDESLPSPPEALTVPFSPSDWQQYYKENWVNDASGYLVVCGKMTVEEENDLLLQVVQAFEMCEDNRDGIAVTEAVRVPVVEVVEAAGVVVAPLSGAELLMSFEGSIPPEMIIRPCYTQHTVLLNDDAVRIYNYNKYANPLSSTHQYFTKDSFSLLKGYHLLPRSHLLLLFFSDECGVGCVSKEESEALCLDIAARGYAVVRMPADTTAVVLEAMQETQRFVTKHIARLTYRTYI